MPGGWNANIMGATALTNQLKVFQTKLQSPVTYVVGTPVEYSVHVELGTSRMQAQPYLRPAVEQEARNLQTIFNNAGSLADALAVLAMNIEARAKRLCPYRTGNLRSSISAERID